jgi:hypothetical protein
MLTPAELEAKSGWKNDPSQVKLLPEATRASEETDNLIAR